MHFARNLVVVTFLFLTTSITFAAGPSAQSDGVQQLLRDTNNAAQVRVDELTGNAKFVRLPPRSLRAGAIDNRAAKPEARARAFFNRYGSAFGVENADTELEAVRTTRDGTGAEHAIFRQKHEALPVFGAELRAHFNARGELFAANGTFLTHIKVDTTPRLTDEQAAKLAIRAIENGPKAALDLSNGPTNNESKFNENTDLSAFASELMIFREGLVRGTTGRDHLVYEVEVRNDGVTVREFVYVDAHSGKVVAQFTGIHDAKFRRSFDAMGAAAPGPNYPTTPFWVEGDVLPSAKPESDRMILAGGETYDLFFNAFGRDSYDGLGIIMDAIFDRGNGCPNASWNGVFISFCPGLTTDDITGHEWAHAYTEYTNNLIYFWQSGALNESYSDIWGEVVDLLNARDDVSAEPQALRAAGACSTSSGGTDPSVRWLMGEDATGGITGAIRDMWNPNCYGDPGKVTDTAQYICTTFDNGGVHINSGIPNHAFALMVDGGTYNGFTVGSIGLTKAAHIHWGAQNMLTPASNFIDQADALEASCAALETAGTDLPTLSTGAPGGPSGEIVSAADCAEVANAIAAVELRTDPAFCGFEAILEPGAPALCAGVGPVNNILTEDFETGSLPAGWTASSHDVVSPGTFDSPGWSVVGGLPGGASGSFAAFGPDLAEGDCVTDIEAGAVSLDSPVIVLPAGEVPHVAFDHYVATEAGWDGGNLKVSVNAGPWNVVPSSAYSFNPYNDALIDAGSGSDNPLGGEEAFTGTDEGSNGGSWGQSQVDLLWVAAAGDTVQFRFDLGTDGCNGIDGWYVDSVQAYSCPNEPFPVCGDGVLDAGQQCDDGNTDDGDGCSSMCQIEDGFVCEDPIPSQPFANVVADGSFEGGVPNADWTPFSTELPIPGFPLCGAANGCPAASLARTGSWLVWIGGFIGGVTSNVEQSVTIPATATDLTLYTWRGICDDAGDELVVSLDGAPIGTLLCDATDGGWVAQTYPVAPYNDGAPHTLLIGGTVGGTNGTHTNFFVEDVVLSDNMPTPVVPSACRPIISELACSPSYNASVPKPSNNALAVQFDEGIPLPWTVVDNEGTGVVWTDIASSGLGGNFTGGEGDAASVNSDAFLFTEYDTELRSNSFGLDDDNVGAASLDYLANYLDINIGGGDLLDVDVSTDGGATWTNELSWNEGHGGFFAPPGEAVSIDLSAYLGESDVQVRWHYYNPLLGDWDWYAQVDNVSLDCAYKDPYALKMDAALLLDSVTDNDSEDIRKAEENVDKSLNSSWWLDDYHLDFDDGKFVFRNEKKAVERLLGVLEDYEDGDDPLDSWEIDIVLRVIEKLVLADDQLAGTALFEATEDVGACTASGDDYADAMAYLAKAEKYFMQAQRHAATSTERSWRAIKKFKMAWQDAVRASDICD